ncbi:MAG: integrase core domain-containing protein [Acidobacteria bacterium]|nr:integrase core domain-containing protein [Acidobacteriota bacterium]
MQIIFLENYFKGYKKVLGYSMIESHPQRETILRRIEIIEFFKEYGKEATEKAYKVKKSAIYLWIQKLKRSGGDLEGLAPKSRAPVRRRKRIVSGVIKDFIVKYREEHPKVCQEAIKPALDKHCKENNLQCISETTIGRIIRDLKDEGRLKERQKKLRIDARTGRLHERKREAQKKERRKDLAAKKSGDVVQIDAMTKNVKGFKRYVISAIDEKSKFGFQYGYNKLTSETARDFMEKLQMVVPFAIRNVQTDNGSEFKKHFDKYLQEKKIPHFFNYPRHPKSNAIVERFNRTTQEQYINWHLDEMADIETFNQGLMEYLLWYNTEKPHKSLKKLTPLDFILKTTFPHTKFSNMYRDTTVS